MTPGSLPTAGPAETQLAAGDRQVYHGHRVCIHLYRMTEGRV